MLESASEPPEECQAASQHGEGCVTRRHVQTRLVTTVKILTTACHRVDPAGV